MLASLDCWAEKVKLKTTLKGDVQLTALSLVLNGTEMFGLDAVRLYLNIYA